VRVGAIDAHTHTGRFDGSAEDHRTHETLDSPQVPLLEGSEMGAGIRKGRCCACSKAQQADTQEQGWVRGVQ
jgi:hypothetical protein